MAKAKGVSPATVQRIWDAHNLKQVFEKRQIQALDRTQPSLPMKPGRAGTMTHDYKRHGTTTTTLFAALNTLDGKVIGQCLPRHRHQEFLKFLRKLDRELPKKPTVAPDPRQLPDTQAPQRRVLATATPPVSPALHAHIQLVAEPRRALVLRAHQQNHPARCLPIHPRLIDAINDYLTNYNQDPTPFTWTASADTILEKITRARAALPTHKTCQPKYETRH